MLGCVFSSYLGAVLPYLLFLSQFEFSLGFFIVVVGVLITGLNRGKHLDAISGPSFFTPGSGSVSHCLIYFFSEITSTNFWKATFFLSPISLIDVACAGFKNPYIIDCLFENRLLLTRRRFWLIVGKINPI